MNKNTPIRVGMTLVAVTLFPEVLTSAGEGQFLAHAGHGPVADGNALHYLTSPEHLVPVVAISIALAAAIGWGTYLVLRKRNYRISKPT